MSKYGEPWGIIQEDDGDGDIMVWSGLRFVANIGERVALVKGHQVAFDIDKANAERIVSCVNDLAGRNPEKVPDLIACVGEFLKAPHDNIPTSVIIDMARAYHAVTGDE